MLLRKKSVPVSEKCHNHKEHQKLHVYTNFKVCMAKFRELYREGSPLQFISTAFFRAVTCFFEFPVSEKNAINLTDTS